MDLEKSCKEGKIRIDEFFEFAVGMRPRRTHFLEVGDYVVSPCFGRKDILAVEEIAELDSPEKGDFETVRGTIGPINGNVFIKINKIDFPKYLLIEGDRIGEAGCPILVYGLVNRYLENRVSRN